MVETKWCPGDSRVGASVPKPNRRGGATRPMHKVSLSGNGWAKVAHSVPFECQNCGHIEWYSTDEFQVFAPCIECGQEHSTFEFDFDLARSLRGESSAE